MTDALHFIFLELGRLTRTREDWSSCRTPLERLAWSLKYMHELDIIAQQEYARKQGFKEGLEKGMEKGRSEGQDEALRAVAEKMRQAGYDVAASRAMTGVAD